MICEICSSILQHQVGLIKDSPDHQRYSHHSTVSSLRESVSQGCYICQTFCNELFDSDQGFSMSVNLTHLVTHCVLTHGENLYRLLIVLAESTNLSNLAMSKGSGSIFLLQPSSGRWVFQEPEHGRPAILTLLINQMLSATLAGHRQIAQAQMNAGSS